METKKDMTFDMNVEGARARVEFIHETMKVFLSEFLEHGEGGNRELCIAACSRVVMLCEGISGEFKQNLNGLIRVPADAAIIDIACDQVVKLMNDNTLSIQPDGILGLAKTVDEYIIKREFASSRLEPVPGQDLKEQDTVLVTDSKDKLSN